MSRFLQIHLLTSYPPANLNRDDLGRPKTSKMGGVERLRVSSQSLKRAWRYSEIFESVIDKGIRTKMIGVDALKKLSEFPALTKTERETIAKNIAKVFGSLKGDSLELDTLAFISDSERANIDKVISSFRNGLGSATVESNAFGVNLFKALSADIQATIAELIRILKGKNALALLKADWDTASGLKEIVKNKNFKTTEDKSPYDYLGRMIEKSEEWLEEILGDQKVPDDHLELFFADEYGICQRF